MAHQVGIVGASGYGGAELVRLLTGHAAMEVAVVAAGSRAGEPVSSLFPNLSAPAVFESVEPQHLAELELVFLAAPHEVAFDLVGSLVSKGTKVVDLSAAFRLPADAFARWYGEPHPQPQLTPATFGLTEWLRTEVSTAVLVANPGCYVTTALLGLLPLASLLIPGTVVIDGKSGTSGAGRGLKDPLHHPHVHGDVVAYAAPTHRHTGEIEYGLDLAAPDSPLGPVSFTPHLVPMSRGLLCTSYAHLREGVDADTVQDALVDAYRSEPFVHVLAPATFPHTKAVAGSNGCQLSAVVDRRTSRVVVTSVTDNLGKGAAGQAIQNANLMLGLEEGLGLSAIGIYP